MIRVLSITLFMACTVLFQYSVFAATISVDTGTSRQTIAGIGGNYAFDKSDTAIGKYTLNNLNPKHIRVEMDLNAWEPDNDNGDPGSFNWTSFKDSGQTHINFLQLQDFKNRGIPVVASIWDVPNWMVQNPADSVKRIIPPAMYDEVVESIAAYLLYARDKYGTTIQFISFNEPDSGYNTLITPSQMIEIIKKAGPRFESLGLSPKWLIGDVSGATKTVAYVTPILQDSSIAQYLGPAVSTHPWNWDKASDTVFSDIYNLANQYGKSIWVEEVGLDSTAWQISGYTSTWSYAFDLARLYYRLIKHMGGSVLTYWEYGNDYPLVNPSSLQPYPAFQVVKQLADKLLPGTEIVESTSSNSGILVFSGRNKSTGTFMVQMINTTSATEVANLSGLPNSSLTLQRISNAENGITVGNYTPSNGTLTFNLPPQSINTLSSSGSDIPPVKPPSYPTGLRIQ
jgi:O-glycosyl hydrolase